MKWQILKGAAAAFAILATATLHLWIQHLLLPISFSMPEKVFVLLFASLSWILLLGFGVYTLMRKSSSVNADASIKAVSIDGLKETIASYKEDLQALRQDFESLDSNVRQLKNQIDSPSRETDTEKNRLDEVIEEFSKRLTVIENSQDEYKLLGEHPPHQGSTTSENDAKIQQALDKALHDEHLFYQTSAQLLTQQLQLHYKIPRSNISFIGLNMDQWRIVVIQDQEGKGIGIPYRNASFASLADYFFTSDRNPFPKHVRVLKSPAIFTRNEDNSWVIETKGEVHVQ